MGFVSVSGIHFNNDSSDCRLALAFAYAAEKHRHQKRRNGSPYIFHPVTVAKIVSFFDTGEEYQTAALLHDVLEDTDAEEAELRELFGDEVTDAVVLLTRPKGADEADYLAKIRTNRIALAVKCADKIHNLHEASYPCKPGSVKTSSDLSFAKRYIKKSEKYYLGTLSPAVDIAIRCARRELYHSVVSTDQAWPVTDFGFYRTDLHDAPVYL